MTDNNSMEALWQDAYLDGDNALYLEELYEQFRTDPASVDASWQALFQQLPAGPLHESMSDVRQRFQRLAKQPASASAAVNTANLDQQLNVLEYLQAMRRFGHLHAKIDPLSLMPIPTVAELDPKHHGLDLNDSTLYQLRGFAGLQQGTVRDCVLLAQQLLCQSIGFEYEHIDSPAESRWLQQRIEDSSRRKIDVATQKQLLQALTEAEGLEKYLGSRFVGEKRFSLEGGESFVPMLHTLIRQANLDHVKEVLIAMAHRGRLNVLVNVFGKSPQELFSQFDGSYQYADNRSDDVKYHYGFSTDIAGTPDPLHLVLGFNPSHLEIVNPVVEGSARARLDRRNDTQGEQVLPIVVHGDSAVAGQGVVLETLAFSQVRGFNTGGTVHIVINNQVGFTTSEPSDTRSTLYCTDIAKAINAPIFHVNGNDPEAAIFAAQLAFDFRSTFHRDVVIDLVCYRRLGHNEGDEPSATQPIMYQTIRKLATTRKLYADHLVQQGVLNAAQVEAMVLAYRDKLDAGQAIVERVDNPKQAELTPDWSRYMDTSWQSECDTTVSLEQLQSFGKHLTTLPADFTLQPQVDRAIKLRAQAYLGEAPLIWGDAETLAYASLLNEGHAVRLCGQDSGRGTFAHRHAEWHNQVTGQVYCPLQHLPEQKARFTVINSLLSEVGVLAFEYGYSTTDPQTLVLWEAQFGDFANGAQVVIDQFLAAGEQKWGRLSGLTLLLPHGYEGMGPEHSSARLERYLQLCAQDNMQVCVPSTPAQMFHLLRRQQLRAYRKPLIVMTPKSLLRKATSTLADMTQGGFQTVIIERLTKAKRVILCSGKVYYDLFEARQTAKADNDIALIRIEQLYPLPQQALEQCLQHYSDVKDIVWAQEEHQNQGAWAFIKLHLESLLQGKQRLQYIGRPESASTAAGYRKLHDIEWRAFLNQAMNLHS